MVKKHLEGIFSIYLKFLGTFYMLFTHERSLTATLEILILGITTSTSRVKDSGKFMATSTL
jgi:hypothetical protein